MANMAKRKVYKMKQILSMAAARRIQSCWTGCFLVDLIIWCSSPLLRSSKSFVT